MNLGSNHFDINNHLEEQFKEALRLMKYELKLTDDVIGEWFGYKASTIRGLLNGNALHAISAGRLMSGLKALSSVGIHNLHHFVIDTSRVRIAPALDAEPTGDVSQEAVILHSVAEKMKQAVSSGDTSAIRHCANDIELVLAKLKSEEHESRKRLRESL